MISECPADGKLIKCYAPSTTKKYTIREQICQHLTAQFDKLNQRYKKRKVIYHPKNTAKSREKRTADDAYQPCVLIL